MKVKEFIVTTKGRVMLAVPAVTSAVLAVSPVVTYAADSRSTTDAAEAVTLFTTVTNLFTTYPLNIYIGGGLVVLGLGIFAKAKRTSKS